MGSTKLNNFENWALWAYFFALLLHVISRSLDYSILAAISKISLMPLLFIASKQFKALLAPLLFSWLGDIFLLKEAYFLFGLCSFFLAHVCYIILLRRSFRWNWPMALVVLFYLLLILPDFIWIGLTEGLKLPVLAYMCIIGIFGYMAISNNKEGKAKSYLAAGAALFILSDTMIAIDKFHHAVAYGSLYIMSSYGLAQFLLMRGFIAKKEELI